MAHRLFEHDMHEATKQAWHGLSVIREEITLADNWLRKWDIVPTPLFFADGLPAYSVEPDAETKAQQWTVSRCNDKPTLQIGAPYNPGSFRPISNAEFLSLVEASISGTSHKIVSVGSVRNRGRVFFSIELKGMEKFKAGGREFSAYLNYGNGHDKSSVLWINTSNTASICDNTFSMNLFAVEAKREESQTESKDDIKARVRHTKNAAMRFPELAKIVDKAIGVQAEFALAMEQAEKLEISEDKARQVFAGFVAPIGAEELSTRAENNVSRMVELFKSGAGNSGRTMGDLFHAATDFYSHESAGADNPAKQFLSSEFGKGLTDKQRFFDLIRNDKQRTAFDKIEGIAKRGETLLAAS